MASRYQTLHAYHDTGSIKDVGAGGYVRERWFRTRFDRASMLVYEFGDTPMPADGRQTTIVAGDARTARIVDSTNESREIGRPSTLMEATAATQGVSAYASLFIPRLLFGLEFCNCTTDPAWRFDGASELEGHRVERMHFRSALDREVTLWLDAESGLLRQVQVARFEAGQLRTTTTIHYDVSQAE